MLRIARVVSIRPLPVARRMPASEPRQQHRPARSRNTTRISTPTLLHERWRAGTALRRRRRRGSECARCSTPRASMAGAHAERAGGERERDASEQAERARAQRAHGRASARAAAALRRPARAPRARARAPCRASSRARPRAHGRRGRRPSRRRARTRGTARGQQREPQHVALRSIEQRQSRAAGARAQAGSSRARGAAGAPRSGASCVRGSASGGGAISAGRWHLCATSTPRARNLPVGLTIALHPRSLDKDR